MVAHPANGAKKRTHDLRQQTVGEPRTNNRERKKEENPNLNLQSFDGDASAREDEINAKGGGCDGGTEHNTRRTTNTCAYIVMLEFG